MSRSPTSATREPVARWARKTYPDCQIIVIADNDLKTEAEKAKGKTGNPGVEHALEAAAAVGGEEVVIPVRAAEPERKCDVNDLHVDEGIEAVRQAPSR